MKKNKKKYISEKFIFIYFTFNMSRQRIYATLLILGSGVLLFRTIHMLSTNAYDYLELWVFILLIAEMLVDLSCRDYVCFRRNWCDHHLANTKKTFFGVIHTLTPCFSKVRWEKKQKVKPFKRLI
jgi:hypothetical protein